MIYDYNDIIDRLNLCFMDKIVGIDHIVWIDHNYSPGPGFIRSVERRVPPGNDSYIAIKLILTNILFVLTKPGLVF